MHRESYSSAIEEPRRDDDANASGRVCWRQHASYTPQAIKHISKQNLLENVKKELLDL